MPLRDRPQRWRSMANCAGQPVDLFYPGKPISTQDVANMKVAKALCADCCVQIDCLIEATVNREQYGIWAGVSPKYRTRLRQRTEPGFNAGEWRLGLPGSMSGTVTPGISTYAGGTAA